VIEDSETSDVAWEGPVAVRAPGRSGGLADLQELWAYRELLYFLTWREVKVRYKQTVLGAAWAILQPFFTMVVFSLIFGKLARMPSDGVPYPIWSYAALLPWQFFAQALSSASGSVVANANLIRKVYFPRLAAPMSGVLFGLVDFTIAFGVLVLMMAYYGLGPSWRVFLLPAFLILAILTALGAGLWLSALTVSYRDFKFVLPFLSQVWLFVTPVIYPSSLLEQPWRTVYGLNPMVGVVEGFRWALLGTSRPGPMVYVSVVSAFALLASGFAYFRRVERTFADVV
jgi:lipopolysaccharide transport system permease protein